MTTVALSETAVADAVQALLPTSAPVHVEGELRRGRSHTSWVLGSRIGPLVGKVALSQRATSTLRLDEQRRLWGMGAPVPRIVGHTTCCEMLDGAALVVSEYLPGRDAEQALADLGDEQARVVVRDLGRAVAQLHRLAGA